MNALNGPSLESSDLFTSAVGEVHARKVFLTKLIDPQGQALEFTYDANFRMTKITDAIGQETLIAYHPTQTYKIVSVTDPFGRVAGFEYTNGKLTKISDTRTPTPITSTFQYTVGDFINQMTTPYGTTSFHHDAQPLDTINRWIIITDPLSQKERVEFRNQAPGVDEAVYRPDEMEPMPAGNLTSQSKTTTTTITTTWAPDDVNQIDTQTSSGSTSPSAIGEVHARSLIPSYVRQLSVLFGAHDGCPKTSRGYYSAAPSEAHGGW